MNESGSFFAPDRPLFARIPNPQTEILLVIARVLPAISLPVPVEPYSENGELFQLRLL
jgi:hypothetical protein